MNNTPVFGVVLDQLIRTFAGSNRTDLPVPFVLEGHMKGIKERTSPNTDKF
jgi:hypothetical protein|tara:strand:+ start:300 stop:452 length:153 start_codon:yes stop_codon:yes gene_type:complete